MSLTAFFAENVEQAEHVFYPASTRIKDENGKPVLWEMRVIDSTEDDALRAASMRRVQIPGKRNQYTTETDWDHYAGRLAVACTVYPNLHDKQLQDSWKVMGAEALAKKMLTAGEFANYARKAQEICGFEDSTLENEVDEAKN